MVKEILDRAGIKNKKVRFLKPPAGTYAVYFMAEKRRGADYKNFLLECSVAIELYSERMDPEAESRIEKELDDLGLDYEKEAADWIDSERLYQVVYNFTYVTKK